jgi:hypothetical protein
MRRLLPALLLAALAFPALAEGKSYVLHHPKHEHCRVHYWKRVEHVKVHGHRVKRTLCVYIAPKAKAPAIEEIVIVPEPAIAAPAPAPVPPVALHAHLDPTFKQDPSDALSVTYSFSASASIGDVAEQNLPSGILFLYSDGSLECAINVGGPANGGQCPVLYSSYGNHSVITAYVSGGLSATEGEVDRIEPPAATITKAWPAPSAKATVENGTAQITLTSPNWQGAASVGIEDQEGQSCQAQVSDYEASCSMLGTPSSLTVNYPGGTGATITQLVAPNGERQLTEEWAPESLPIIPKVTAYAATLSWAGWEIGTSGRAGTFGKGAPPDPIILNVGERLILKAAATGNFPGDETPLGFMAFTAPDAETTNDLDGSADCSEVFNGSGQAVAQCSLVYPKAGDYPVNVGYASADSHYGDEAGPSASVEVR